MDARRTVRTGGRDTALVLGWTVLLTVVLLRPVGWSGYLLGHDLVFTPQQPLDADAFGLGSAAPRAVPLDALVALAERVLDGAVIGRIAVAVPLLAAGLGAAAVFARRPVGIRLAAATAMIWNPYVVERLALGQWALLWAYAALPWLVLAALAAPGRGGWAGRALAVAAASITPTGGVVATFTAVGLAVGQRRPRREVLGTAAVAVVLQLPWLVPALVSTASSTSDPAGVAAFSARAEHPGGVLLSLLGGGGIWDAEVVPGSRSGGLPFLWLAVLAAAAVYGTARLATLLGRRVLATWAVLAAVGLLVAWLPALPGGAALTRAAVAHLPGAGLLRDAQKWILPLVVLEALLVAAALDRAVQRLRGGAVRGVAVVAACALPLIALPDGPATLRTTLRPVHYPADWSAVASRVGGGGDVAVLPWGSYRRFSWAPGRSVLDPAPRLLPVPTVVDDRLAVSGRLLAGESRRADRVRRALGSGTRMPAALAAAGIRWVLVERGTPGAVPDLAGLRRTFAGPDLTLYRVPGPVRADHPARARVAVVAVADGIAALTLLALAAGALAGRRRRSRPKTPPAGTPPLL